MLSDECSNFMKIYDANQFPLQSKIMIIFTDQKNDNNSDIEDIFKFLWKLNARNVNVIYRDNVSIKVVTFFPFQRHHCEDTMPVLINQFIDNKFINSTANFYPQKFNDLQECFIRVATSNNSIPFVFATQLNNGSYDLHGRDITLLEALANALNFKLNYTYVGFEGVLLENGTALGTYRQLMINNADIAVADMWLKANRLKFIDASISYITSQIAFIIPPGSELTSFEKYIKPLDMVTWLCLCLTIVIAFIVIFIVRKMPQEAQEFIFGVGVNDPYLNVFNALLGGSQPVLPQRNFARFLLMCFLIFCLVIRNLYQGSLYRFLQTKITHKEVQTIDEMIERDYKFYAVPSIVDLIEGQPRIYERYRNHDIFQLFILKFYKRSTKFS
jgi:hypothetical protein